MVKFPYINPISFGREFFNKTSEFEQNIYTHSIFEVEDFLHFQINFDKTLFRKEIQVKAYLIDSNLNVNCELFSHKIVDIGNISYWHFNTQIINEYIGVRYVMLECYYVDGTIDKYYSLPIHIANKHIGSMLLEYRHSTNDFDIISQPQFIAGSGISFRERYIIDTPMLALRIFGGVQSKDITASAISEVYADVTHNLKLLHATPFNNFKLIFGNNKGLASWQIDLINRVFCCEFIYLNGTKITKKEGAELEQAWSIDYYPLAIYGLECGFYENDISKKLMKTIESGIGEMVIEYNFTIK